MQHRSSAWKTSFPVFLFLSLFICTSLQAQENRFIQKAQSLPVARGFHGTAVLGDYLYVLGGSYYTENPPVLDPAAVVHVAKIYPNGHLSNFIETTPLPNPRHYINNSTIVLNDTVYVLGGSTKILDGERLDTVLWTRPMANGHLVPWQESEPFASTGLSCVAAFSTPGYLHMTGGLSPNRVSDKVWSVRIMPDGSLGRWEESAPLPAPFWFHCGAVVGGRAYVWGGLHRETENPQPSRRIFSAPVLSSGKLGTWSEASIALPKGFYSASSAVAGPYLFSLAPRYGKDMESNDVWWTYMTPNGMTGWKRRQTDMGLRVYHASATDYRRGIIYLTGGKFAMADPPSDLAYLLKLSPSARQVAEKSWTRAQVAHADAISMTQMDMAASPEKQETQFSFEKVANQSQGLIGFHDLDKARELSRQKGMPMVMYFRAEEVIPCKKQNEILNADVLKELGAGAVLADIDARQSPQVAQQYGVFQVPTWIFYDQRGEELDRMTGVQNAEELKKRITALN